MTARNSHLAALGLVRNPFPCTPDAGCYFSTPHLEEQMVELAHCIQARKGFTLLTAEVGMGKSTLVRRLMTDLASKQVVSALVFNTFLQGPELLAAVLQDFGLPSGRTMSADIAELNAFLLKNHAEGKTCLLIIDDAQNLSESSLELIRLLCNLETDQEKLLQIMLAGQPELEESLSQHNLRQLRSRLVKHARLHGLNSTEIADYVKFRFDSAGSDGALVLQADACLILWKESRGVPRHIHLIMDRCLYGLAARDGNVIDAVLMKQAIDDSRVDLVGPTWETEMPVSRARSNRSWAVITGLLGVALVGGAAWTKVGPSLGVSTPIHASGTADPTPVVPPMNTLSLISAKPGAAHQPVTSGAATPPPSPEVSMAFSTPRAAPAEQASGDASSACSAHDTPQQDRKVISQPLPELTSQLLGSRIARWKDACLQTRQGQQLLTWSTPLTGYDMGQPLTVARFQIALTQYGSLLPTEVDGVWGEHSQGALKQFQSALGLGATGDIDALSGLLLERFYVQEQ
jgi:general secretion pathway protein A